MKKRTSLLLPLSALAIGVSLTACTAASSTSSHTQSPAPASAGAHLPASFPTHDVPLLSGKLIVASGDDADGWTVTVQPSDGDFAAAEAALKRAGYTATRSGETSATFTDKDYTVSLQTPGKTVTYLVTKE